MSEFPMAPVLVWSVIVAVPPWAYSHPRHSPERHEQAPRVSIEDVLLEICRTLGRDLSYPHPRRLTAPFILGYTLAVVQ